MSIAMSEEKNKGNIILYQTSDGQSKIEVTLSNDTVWLTADQMAELFQQNKSTISRQWRVTGGFSCCIFYNNCSRQ